MNIKQGLLLVFLTSSSLAQEIGTMHKVQLYDSTSNNNNGGSFGTTYSNDCKINGGRQYNGDDYITVEDFPHLPTALTAEAWVYRDDTTYISIFTKGLVNITVGM